MSSLINYETCFNPYIGNFVKVTLDKEHSTRLGTAIAKLMRADERKYNRALTDDERNNYKKLFMQIAGETVLEQYFDLDFVEYDNLRGCKTSFLRKTFNVNVEVCTFSHGVFPLMYNPPYNDYILVCMISKTEYYICGLGERQTLRTYSRSDLVQSLRLRESGKVGFYGFYRLQPLPSQLTHFLKLVKK